MEGDSEEDGEQTSDVSPEGQAEIDIRDTDAEDQAHDGDGTEDDAWDAEELDSPDLHFPFWARSYGTENGYETAREIDQTSDGGFVMAGDFDVFGPEASDFWVVRLDAAGGISWQKRYGGNGEDQAHSVSVLDDGGFLVSGDSKSFAEYTVSWVLRLDPDGGIVWQKAYVGETAGEQSPNFIRVSTALRDGGSIVTGPFHSDHTSSGVMRLDADGNLVWHRFYNPNGGSLYTRGVVEAPDGGYVIVGDKTSYLVVMRLDHDGEMVWQNNYVPAGGLDCSWGACGVDAASDGGIIVTGTSHRDPAGASFFITKLDAAGNLDWHRSHGDVGSQEGTSIAKASDGGFIAAGESSYVWTAHPAFLVMKTDASGSIEWQRYFGGEFADVSFSVVQTADGGYVSAGYTTSFGAGLRDAWVIRLRPDGSITGNCRNISCDGCTTSEAPLDVAVEDAGMTEVPVDITAVDTGVTPLDTDAVAILQCME